MELVGRKLGGRGWNDGLAVDGGREWIVPVAVEERRMEREGEGRRAIRGEGVGQWGTTGWAESGGGG